MVIVYLTSSMRKNQADTTRNRVMTAVNVVDFSAPNTAQYIVGNFRDKYSAKLNALCEVFDSHDYFAADDDVSVVTHDSKLAADWERMLRREDALDLDEENKALWDKLFCRMRAERPNMAKIVSSGALCGAALFKESI